MAFYETAVAALRASPHERFFLLLPENGNSSIDVSAAVTALGSAVETARGPERWLRNFSYVVHGGTVRKHWLIALKGIRILWYWCPTTSHACRDLPDMRSDPTPLPNGLFVQARLGPTDAALEVRSNLGTTPRWVTVPVRRARVESRPWEVGELSFDNVCYALGPASNLTGPSMHGKIYLAQADNATGELLWPLRWPPHFEEGSQSPVGLGGEQDAYAAGSDRTRVLIVARFRLHPETLHSRRDIAHYAVAAKSFRRIWHERAFVGVLTQDNLWHALFHAIPTSEHFERLSLARFLAAPGAGDSADGDDGRMHFLPRYTRFWPTRLQLMELGATTTQSWQDVFPVARWVGWQLIVRGLRGASWSRSAQTTQRLVDELGVWRCYRSMHGGHQVYWPAWSNITHMAVHYRPRLAIFRAHLLASFDPLMAQRPVRERILVILRRGRGFANEDQIRDWVEQDASLAPLVEFVRLEEHPLTEQLSYAMTSTSIVGMHGQGLTFVAFLPPSRWTGLLEVIPHMMVLFGSHAFYDYSRWARVSGVNYFRLFQPDDASCFCQYFRVCGKVIVNEHFITALHLLRTHTAPTCHVGENRHWFCEDPKRSENSAIQFATSSAYCIASREHLHKRCRNITTSPSASFCKALPPETKARVEFDFTSRGSKRCACSKT